MSPYLHGVMGYPLLPWFMTLHKEDEKHHSILELLYNCKHKWGKLVVENTFGILKETFIELLKKTKLHVTILQCVQLMFFISFVIWSLGGKRWMSLGAHVSYLDWSHVRGWVQHKWITTIWKHYSHWRHKALKGITPPQPKGVLCRSTLLKGATTWDL